MMLFRRTSEACSHRRRQHQGSRSPWSVCDTRTRAGSPSIVVAFSRPSRVIQNRVPRTSGSIASGVGSMIAAW